MAQGDILSKLLHDMNKGWLKTYTTHTTEILMAPPAAAHVVPDYEMESIVRSLHSSESGTVYMSSSCELGHNNSVTQQGVLPTPVICVNLFS